MPLNTSEQDCIRTRSESVETCVVSAWDEQARDALPQASLLAVGGFGRRELFPYSDVDVIVLLADSSDDAACRQPVGQFMQAVWDAGLRLSHSVHTVGECMTLHDRNVELNTSLLDWRFLTGASAPAAELGTRWPQFLQRHGRELARAIAGLTRERHAKYHNTIFQLEPNIKEGPGGLRDLHVIAWTAGLLGADVRRNLGGAREFLAAVRCFLHQRAGRDYNVLDFDAQEAMDAEPAQVMRDYYRHAREVLAETQRLVGLAEDRTPSLIDQFRDWRSRLSNADFTVLRERVYLRSPTQLESDPDLAVRLFAFLARHNLELASDTEHRVAEHFARGQRRPPGWPAWQSILLQPHASAGLRAMQATGAMRVWLPEWTRIESLVVRDFYHRYTVDEHTLVAIDSFEFIQDRRYRELFAEVDRPDLLRFAVLLHDIGKGGGDHVRVSRELASEIAMRIAMPESDRDVVLFLVANHLLLSDVATARDLGDPATAARIAGAVETIERLKLLTLMTYADISAVHPAAMTPWRAEQLWRAYLTGYEELTRELAAQRIHALADVPPEVADFVEGFPIRYQRTHTRDEMQAHLELSRQAEKRGVAVQIRKLNGFYEATIAGKDRPGFLAAISGGLASFGMSILKAEAFSNAHGVLLDVFVFSDPMKTLDLNASEVERLEQVLTRVAIGREDVARLLQRRPRPKPHPSRLAPSVRFENKPGAAATRVEVVAQDRPGLLYDLVSALSEAGCNIEVVLIDTEAHKALDVLYVTRDGRALDPGEHASLRGILLAASGENPENSASRAGSTSF